MVGFSVCLTLLYFLMKYGHETGVGVKEAGPQNAESAALKLHCFTRRKPGPCPSPFCYAYMRTYTQKKKI